MLDNLPYAVIENKYTRRSSAALLAVRDRRLHHEVDEPVHVLQLPRIEFRGDRGSTFELRDHGERALGLRADLHRLRQLQLQLLGQPGTLDQEPALPQRYGQRIPELRSAVQRSADPRLVFDLPTCPEFHFLLAGSGRATPRGRPEASLPCPKLL